MFQKYKRPLLFIISSFKDHKKMFYVFFIGKIVEGLFYVGLPLLAKIEMDQLVEKEQQLFGFIELNSFSIFLVILCVIFFITLVQNILKSFIALFEYDYVKLYDNYYSEALYNRLANVDVGLFLNARNKRFIGDILSESSIIGDSIRSMLGGIITNIFVIIGIITVLSFINIWILFILIVSSSILYFISKLKEKYNARTEFEDNYEFDEKLWILKEQMAKNLTKLMSTGGFDLVLEYFKKGNNELKNRLVKNQKKNYILSMFGFITENISEIGVKLVVGYGIFFSGLSIGTMTMTLLYVSRLSDFFESFWHTKHMMNRLCDNILQLDIFLDLTENKKSKTNLIKDFKEISIKNLQFTYPNFAKEELRYLEITENRIKSYGSNGEYEKNELLMIAESREQLKNSKNPIILQSINLDLSIGKTYGLVGKNGAGKTTLISLILNYFDDYGGNLLFGKQEVKDLERNFFIKNISIVDQVPYIIEGFTLRENILLGVSNKIEDEKIIELLEKFNLYKKIKIDPKGLDAKIGYENDFSGGEKQILVLIRIILQNRKILIMDEGTNQLDAENELLVMEELLKNKSGKIIIFITHRMTTIRKADTIFCLENGKIVTQGNHKELLACDNIYKTFWEKQVVH